MFIIAEAKGKQEIFTPVRLEPSGDFLVLLLEIWQKLSKWQEILSVDNNWIIKDSQKLNKIGKKIKWTVKSLIKRWGQND